MARGRMLNSTICMDKRVNLLSDDTCRLLFTWLIPWADVDGRFYGDPAVVRSRVFPRREDISIEQVDGYLNEMHNLKDGDGLGLIVRYEVDGELYIWFPNFGKNQAGLRREREANSIIPPPPTEPETDHAPDEKPSDTEPAPTQEEAAPMTEDCRSNDGGLPDQIPVNLNELNLIKQKGKEENGKGQLPISSHTLSQKQVTPEQAWESIKELAEPPETGARHNFRLKVDHCQVAGLDGQTLRIRAPDKRMQGWLSGLFGTRTYQAKIAAVMGEGSRIVFEV